MAPATYAKLEHAMRQLALDQRHQRSPNPRQRSSGAQPDPEPLRAQANTESSGRPLEGIANGISISTDQLLPPPGLYARILREN